VGSGVGVGVGEGLGLWIASSNNVTIIGWGGEMVVMGIFRLWLVDYR
jgi:hypothetical protein